MYGSPPATLHIPSAQACEYLRAAFRLWTTELRPMWTPNGCGNPPDEECLLLAELNVPMKQDLSGQWVVDDAIDIFINQERRPYLIHLRLLQEWLLCGIHQHQAIETLVGDVTGKVSSNTVERIQHINVASGTPNDSQVLTYNSEAKHWEARDIPSPSATLELDGDVTGDITHTTVKRIQHISVAAGTPNIGQVLTFVNSEGGGQWQGHDLPLIPIASNAVSEERTFDLPARAGTSTEYSRADHTHGTPPDPIPPHRADANAHTLVGDVIGPIGTTTVVQLQGRPVAATPPNQGQVLTFQNNQWQAANPANAGGNAVEHPAGLPPYLIVAAGIVISNQAALPNMFPNQPNNPDFFRYNKLQVVSVANGEVKMTFGTYVIPPGPTPDQPGFNHLYIIKVLPVFSVGAELLSPSISFLRFEQDGFVIRVLQGNQPVSQGQLARQAFMVEVSQLHMPR
jgi:hypothetical protein